MCHPYLVMTSKGYEHCETIGDLIGALGTVKVLPEHAGKPVPPDACLCGVDAAATARLHSLSVFHDEEEYGIVLARAQ